MKKKFSVFFILLLLATPLISQQRVFLQEKEIAMEEYSGTAWIFPVAGDIESALDHLKDYCKERSDVRMRNEGDHLVVAEEVSIPTIATQRGDLIGNGFPHESYNAMGIAFKLGYDIYLNSDMWDMEMNNLRNYAKEFMSYHYERFFAEQIEAVEDQIKTLERDLNREERDVESLNRKIERAGDKIEGETEQEEIEALNTEIATLRADRERLNETIPELQTRIDLLKTDVENLKNQSLTIQSAISSL